MNSNFKNDVFIKRFAELRKENEESNRDLQEIFGLSVSAVINYQTGKRTPDIAFLHKLAEHYNVSADYLLGLSDAKTTEQDMKIACEVTGLSEKAIENIKSAWDDKFILNFLAKAYPKNEYERTEINKRKNDFIEQSKNGQKQFNNFIENKQFINIIKEIQKSYDNYNLLKNKQYLMKNNVNENGASLEITEYFNIADEYEKNLILYKSSLMDVYDKIKDFIENSTKEDTENG